MFKFLKLLNKDVIFLPKNFLQKSIFNITFQHKSIKRFSYKILDLTNSPITFESLTKVVSENKFKSEEISNAIFSIDYLIISNYYTITLSQLIDCLTIINFSSEAYETGQYVIEKKLLELMQKYLSIRSHDLMKIFYELAKRKKNFFIDQIFKEAIRHFPIFEDHRNFSSLIDFISLYFLKYDEILANPSLKHEMLNILNQRILIKYDQCNISDFVKLISITGQLNIPNLDIINRCYKYILGCTQHSRNNYDEILIFIGLLISQNKAPEIRKEILSNYFSTKVFLTLISTQKLKFRFLCFLNFNKEISPGYYIQYLTDFNYDELITLLILTRNSNSIASIEMIGNKFLQYNDSWKLNDLSILIELYKKMKNQKIREEFYKCFEKYYAAHKEKMNNKIIAKMELVFEEQKKKLKVN